MRMMNRSSLHAAAAFLLAILLFPTPSVGQTATLLRPDGVYDGETSTLNSGWVVLVEGNRIAAVGPPEQIQVRRGTEEVDLSGLTLLPGLIEGHAHLLLHPYDETPWTDQVLLESLAERTARAVVHAEKSLMAGITTVRDLGTEGAGYADVGLKAAIEKGVIPGPRLIVTGRAIVATGSYNPRGAPEWDFPKGAEEADGYDDLVRVTRDQIGRGADWVKIYADYRWGPDGTAAPTFTQEELNTVVRFRRAQAVRWWLTPPRLRPFAGRWRLGSRPSSTETEGIERCSASWPNETSPSARPSEPGKRTPCTAAGRKGWIRIPRGFGGRRRASG
jgi:hypothetical protein